MLRKISAVLFISVLLLTGCGSSTDKESVSISTIYDGIAPMADSTLVTMEDNYILNYYGIDTNDLDEYVFSQSDDPKSADTIIMFRCSDSEKIKTYQESLENFLSQREGELENYDLPEEAKLVKNAKVVTKGDFVYLVIADNAKDMTSIISDSI